MIFVTVGTDSRGFERLIRKVDKLKEKGAIKEKVTMQIAGTEYTPKFCKWFRYCKKNKIKKLTENSSLVISHCGVGSILQSIESDKLTIFVPRLKKFEEAVDNHQLEFAKNLGKYKKFFFVYDVEKLENAIKKARSLRLKKSIKNKEENSMIKLIWAYIQKWKNENTLN